MAVEVSGEMEVVKYRIAVALALGAGFISLVFLLLKVLMATTASMLLFLLLLPGGIAVAALSASGEFSAPLAVLAANVLIYSGVSFVLVSILWRHKSVTTWRRVALWLVGPAAMLLVLSCIPVLNPLWPRGMVELGKQEKELQDSLPLGMSLEEVRARLRSKGIAFQEARQSSESVVLKRQGKSITAVEGDQLISTRFETGSGQFPCGYDMEIVLLFDRDKKLKEQYVHRLRVCP